MTDTKKKWLMRIGITIPMLLLLIQVVPYGRAHDNPPVAREPAWDTPQTRAFAVRACFDCHSNQTKWPWYSNVAPVSWIVQHHVEDGRKHLNFSEWGKPQRHAHEAAEEFEAGNMPLEGYVPLHPEARLSPEETQLFLQGLKATFGEKKEKR